MTNGGPADSHPDRCASYIFTHGLPAARLRLCLGDRAGAAAAAAALFACVLIALRQRAAGAGDAMTHGARAALAGCWRIALAIARLRRLRAVPALLAAEDLGHAERAALQRGHRGCGRRATTLEQLSLRAAEQSISRPFPQQRHRLGRRRRVLVTRARGAAPATRCRASASAASRRVTFLLLLTQMFPLVMLIAPIYRLLTPLGLTNSLIGPGHRLHRLQRALRHLPDAVLLRRHPEGARGGGDDRRLHAASRRCARSILPLTLPGMARDARLRLHRRLERAAVRADADLQRRARRPSRSAC